MTHGFGKLHDGTVVPLDKDLNIVKQTDSHDEFSLEIVDEYLMTAQVSIGTPPVTGTLMIVDSSPFVTVYGTNCIGCDRTAFYDPTQSSTFSSPLNPFKQFDWFNIDALSSIGYDTVCLLGAAAGGTDLCNDHQLVSMLDSYTLNF